MNKNIHRVFFLTTLLVLLVGLGALSATDVSDNTTTTQSIAQDTPSTSTQVASTVSDTTSKVVEDTKIATTSKTKSVAKENTQTSAKTTKAIKSTPKSIDVTSNNFDSYFTSSGLNGVNNGDTLNLKSDVSRNDKSYIVDKAVNINGNNYTINLNTNMASHATAINFVAGASNSNVSYIHFHNTQVYVNTTSNITFDHINVTDTNNAVGVGVGVFSIRDGSRNITVNNSYFRTENNGGFSTLVLTYAKDCTINNNTVIGVGKVGNLIYLNTYGGSININNITQNENNTISNNRVTGPTPANWTCYAITISGPSNKIINNTINYTGAGITTIWAGNINDTTPKDIHNTSYRSNEYINNTILNGASFLASDYSYIEGNVVNSLSPGKNSTVINNNITGTLNLEAGSKAIKNNVNVIYAKGNNVIANNNITTLNVTGSNVTISLSNGRKLYVGSGLTNIRLYNSNFRHVENYSEIENNPSSSNTKSLKSETVTENGVEWTVYRITKDTYDDYVFDGFIDVDFEPHTLIYFEYLPVTGTFEIGGIAYRPWNGYEVKMVGLNNFTLNNVCLRYQNQPSFCNITTTVANMTINNTGIIDENGGSSAFWANENLNIENVTIISNTTSLDGNLSVVNIGRNCSIKNCNIISYNGRVITGNAYAINIGSNSSIENSNINTTVRRIGDSESTVISAVHTTSDNVTISGCNITANVPSNYINWGVVSHPSSMVIYTTGRNTVIDNNNILINDSGASDSDNYNTLYGMYIGNDATITNNNINITGNEYLYGIQLRGSNNNVSNNNISEKATNYLSGIMLEGQGMQNNTIAYNNIVFTGGNRSADSKTQAEDSVYGISIQNFGYSGHAYTAGTGNIINNKLINNNITGTGYNVYAFEQFGGDNTTVTGNNINITAHTPMGIGIIGAYNNASDNNITVNGADNGTYNSADFLKPRTTGVYFAYGINNTATNNNINCSNNAGMIISSEKGSIAVNNTVQSLNNTYAVSVIDDASNVTVTNNTLIARELKGDKAVLNNGTDNTVKDNGPKTVATTLGVDNITSVKVGNNITVTGKLVDETNTTVTGAVITVVSGNTTINTTTDANGSYVASIPTSNVGTFTVTLTYDGDDNYLASNTTANYTVDKLNTTVILNNISSVKIGNNITVTGKLVDETNTTVTGAVITVVSGNTTINTTTDANGSYVASIPTTNVGSYNVTVSFAGDANYAESSVISNYTVEKHTTSLTVNPIESVKSGNNIIITGRLVDETGSLIQGAIIHVLNGNETRAYTGLTNSSGTFTVRIAVTNAGTYNLILSFNGNSRYDASNATANYTVNKLNTTITVTPVTGVLGRNISIIAHVVDENNKTVNGGFVVFKVNGVTLKDANNTAVHVDVVNGTAVLNTIGTWINARNVSASYSGTDYVYNQARTDNGTISLANQNATVNMTINRNLKPGSRLVAVVHITDANGNPVNAGKVVFKLNGKTLKINGTTAQYNVTNGTVTLNYIVPEDYSAKTYRLSAIFGGNIYNRAETRQNFTLAKLNATVKLNIVSKNVKPGQKLIATANITDTNGNPVTRGKAIFKINGKTLKDTRGNTITVKVVNGQAVLNYTIPTTYSGKTYNLTVQFGGSNYNNVRTSTNLTLAKINTRIQNVTATINGNTLRVKANIINNDTNRIANQRPTKVTIKIDKKTIIKQRIVNNGIIDINTTVSTKIGQHTVEIISGENGLYKSSRQTVTATKRA